MNGARVDGKDQAAGSEPATPVALRAGRDGLPRAIAIDGPAGAGKTTIAVELARRLGYFYFDTGALYRAVTLAALRAGLAATDGEGLARLLARIDIDVEAPRVADGRTQTVLLDGEDVTWLIRSPEVDRGVSAFSAIPAVRAALLERQRAVAARGGVIMAGRDIGTVVLPDAELKLYLEASTTERAERRLREERARGAGRTLSDVLAEMELRDAGDASRALSPLRPASDAVVLDTTGLDVEGVLRAIGLIIDHRAAHAARRA